MNSRRITFALFAFLTAVLQSRAGTIAYWQFDSSTNTPGLADSVGNHDFTASGSFNSSFNAAANPVPNPDATGGFSGDPSANPDSGLSYASLLCNGGTSTDRLTAQNDTGDVFNMSGKDFTFEGWFQHSTNSTPAGFGDIIAATRVSGSFVGYSFQMNSSGAIYAYVDDGPIAWGATAQGTNYNDGAFHHFAFVWQDGAGTNSNGYVEIYMDGSLEANASAPAGFNAAVLDAGDNDFAIAGRDVSDCTWDGRFDEFRFSDTALEPSQFLLYDGIDTNAPIINAYYPLNNATNVATDVDLVAVFDELIVTNTVGSVVLTNVTDGTAMTIAIGDTSQVTATGSSLTIDPTNDLDHGKSYAVLIATNALMDSATNFFAGITDSATWGFTTTPPDTTAPSIVDRDPADDAINVAVDISLLATFDEPITLKNGGTVTLTDLTDGSSTTVMTLPDGRVGSPSGDDLSIDLSSDLDLSTEYSVRISSDAIEDQALPPNAFAGITDDATWNFATESSTKGGVKIDDSRVISSMFGVTGTLFVIDVPWEFLTNSPTIGPNFPNDADDSFIARKAFEVSRSTASRWEPDGTSVANARTAPFAGSGGNINSPDLTWTFDLPDGIVINAVYATWTRTHATYDRTTWGYTEGTNSATFANMGANPVSQLVIRWIDDVGGTHDGSFQRIFTGPILVEGGNGFTVGAVETFHRGPVDAVMLDVTFPPAGTIVVIR